MLVKINHVPVTAERDLRINMQKLPDTKCPMMPGDLLFIKGSDWISMLIRWSEKAKITHAAMAIDAERIIEADMFVPIKIKDNYYKKYILMRADLTDEQRRQLVETAKRFLGKRFDYYNAFIWLLRLILRKRSLGPRNDEKKLFCSELVDRIYTSCGIDLLPGQDTGNVLPTDLMKSPLLKEVICDEEE